MPRPTARGLALLGLAVGTYLAGRVVGTWELYLFALTFAAVAAVSWALVAVVGRRIRVSQFLTPDRPVAGDEPEYSVVVSNRSWLPSPPLTLRSRLTSLCACDLDQEVPTLAPRMTKTFGRRLPPVLRGVHHLPALEVLLEDPLGLMCAARADGRPWVVTVYPRLLHLTSCVLFPELGLKHDWAGRHGLPAPGAAEFRSVRPHQPGEPLNRIDWKSTAKTGVLMLREMEDPAGADLTLLLDGSEAQVVGTAPHSNFELAVRVTGSVADFALRAGRGVTLLCHERVARRLVLTPDGSGRRTLLEGLAAAAPTARATLEATLRRLLAGESRLLWAPGATVVSLSLDTALVRTLLSMREQGMHLSFIYISGPSFAGVAPPSAGAGLSVAGATGRHPLSALSHPSSLDVRASEASTRASGPSLSAEMRALLLSLSAAGIPTLVLGRGDDLAGALSGWGRGRRGAAAAAGS